MITRRRRRRRMTMGGFGVIMMFMVMSLMVSVVLGEGLWLTGSATFYGDIVGHETRDGACGYDDTVAQGYGLNTAALSTALLDDGLTCGACYEVTCTNSTWCRLGTITITATNLCPPNWAKPSDAGGWCNPPRDHFDLTMPMFLKIAEYKAGIVPIQYRRVLCSKTGGIKFEVKSNSNPNWIAVLVFNVAGNGDVKVVSIKGSRTGWISMSRNWGQIWQTVVPLLGQALSFQVTTSDGRMVQLDDVAGRGWEFGQTFEAKKNIAVVG